MLLLIWLPKDIVQQMLLAIGTKEGKDWSWHAKEDAEGGWLEGCEDMENKGKGLYAKIQKDPEKKLGSFTYLYRAGLAPPISFLLLSTHYCSTWTATSSSSFPLVSLGSTHILPRLQRKFMFMIAKKIPGTSCVPFKQLRVWGKVGNLRKHFHKGPDICACQQCVSVTWIKHQ